LNGLKFKQRLETQCSATSLIGLEKTTRFTGGDYLTEIKTVWLVRGAFFFVLPIAQNRKDFIAI
jgi:hypothetical protein